MKLVMIEQLNRTMADENQDLKFKHTEQEKLISKMRDDKDKLMKEYENSRRTVADLEIKISEL